MSSLLPVRAAVNRISRLFVAALLPVFFLGGMAAPSDTWAAPDRKAGTNAKKKAKNQKSPARQANGDSATGPKPNPDALLSGIYMDLAAGKLRPAMAKADQLVEAYPNFRLGHLIRGDLLMMHVRPVSTIGHAPNGAPEDKLKDLRAEAMARLKALHRTPDPDLFPRVFMQLREDHKYLLLVDARQSRLFVYLNKGGVPVLLNHYYISQGKLGVHKTREGDQKTPIGIYRITSRIAREKLPDFYGTGALTLNYPNDWDKLNGRSGSGIWFHGMPSESFSRPPLASDGCVALTNPDMSELAGKIDIYKTLVVISDRVEMVNARVRDKDRKTAMAMLEKWRRAMDYGNRAVLRRHYSDKFRSSANEDVSTWIDRQSPADPRAFASHQISELTLLRYPGAENMVAAAFRLNIQSGKIVSQTRRFQLWVKEGPHWKIIYENAIKDFL